MPRYMVQRTFTDSLYILADEDGAKRLQAVGQANAAHGLPVDTITEVSVLDPYFYY